MSTTKGLSEAAFIQAMIDERIEIKTFTDEELQKQREKITELAQQLGRYLPVKWHFIVRQLVAIERAQAMTATLKHLEDMEGIVRADKVDK